MTTLNWNDIAMLVMIIIIVWLFGASVGTAIGEMREYKSWQEKLVKQGLAEYYLDENNERKWRMKEKQ